MSRPLQNSTTNSIPAPSSPFIENNSPCTQQNTSPINIQYHSNSPVPTLHQMFANDPVGLSPMPPNSPSPNMWQAQSMDLENEMDIKMEPFDALNMDGGVPISDYVMNEFDEFFSPSHSAGFGDFPSNCNDVADLFTNNIEDTTCLDPQHSSPAAMAAVRPDEVMGISRSSSSYEAPQPSTSFGFSDLIINSPQANNMQQQFENNQRHSHSFTPNSFPSNQVSISNNNGSVAHSGMMSGGSIVSTQQEAFAIKSEGDNLSQVVSSYPPSGIVLKDSLNCSSLPSKQAPQVSVFACNNFYMWNILLVDWVIWLTFKFSS